MSGLFDLWVSGTRRCVCLQSASPSLVSRTRAFCLRWKREPILICRAGECDTSRVRSGKLIDTLGKLFQEPSLLYFRLPRRLPGSSALSKTCLVTMLIRWADGAIANHQCEEESPKCLSSFRLKECFWWQWSSLCIRNWASSQKVLSSRSTWVN